MLRVALIGDLHLDERGPRFLHTVEVLDAALTDAIAQGAHGVVFLGDLCEGRPSPRVIDALGGQWAAVHRAGLWVAVVQGNHEDPEAGLVWRALGVRRSAWDAFEAIHEAAASLVLVPYPRRGRPPFHELVDDGTVRGSMAAAAARIAEHVLEEAAATRAVDGTLVAGPTPVIVLGHFTIEGMTTRDAEFELHQATEVVVPRAALAPAALTAVGHIHRAQDAVPDEGWILTDGSAAAPRGTVLGVGSLVRHSFGEADDSKSYTLVSIEDGRIGWQRRAVPARPMVSVHVTWDPAAGGDNGILEHVLDEWEGAEVKLTVEIPENQLGTFDPAVFNPARDVAAHFVLDRQTVSIERTRAPEIAAAETIDAQLAAWLAATGADVDAAAAARLTAKLAEVTT